MSESVDVEDERTVPRQLVHRQSVHEVFLTSVTPLDELRSVVTMQWPRWHSTTGAHVPTALGSTLVLEGVRQIGIYLAHTAWDVGLDEAFIARVLGFQWTGRPPTAHYGPFEASALTEMREVRPGRGAAGGLNLGVRLAASGEEFGRGRGELTCISQRLYQRLRGSGRKVRSNELDAPPPSDVLATTVGRESQSQVVITQLRVDPAGQTASACLRVDATHPFYFDHPADHVPAALVLEAAQQLATPLLVGRPIAGIVGRFHRYLELTDPIFLELHRSSFDRLQLRATQGGEIAAEVDVDGAATTEYLDLTQAAPRACEPVT